ncbi:hypothetical protein [Streptomyces sp. NPDC023838]|uniref:hypothetical protein n=1 Tax=Streptomyces sp. NPDC023838 TaxID=3154325 RepID=UPI0033D42D71
MAVLRNHTADGGAEAWIRAVGPDWKPSDGYAGKVLAVLDRTHTSATVGGLKLRLAAATAEIPMLDVTGATGSRTILFPERVNDGAPVLRTVSLKGGLTAKVYHRGDQHKYYTATVLKGTKELGELTAGAGYPSKDTKRFGSVQVTLDSGGDVTSAEVGSDSQDVGGRKLADGTYGELWKKGTGQYVLELDRDGYHVTLAAGGPASGPSAGEQVDSMWVGLDNAGKVGSWLNKSGGFDAGAFEYTKGCTAYRTSGSPFDGLSLRLSNGPKGAVAEVLNAKNGTVYDTLSTTDREGVLGGARVKDLEPGRPTFQMRVHGGQTPWDTVKFPKKPATCATTPGDKTATATGTGTTAQTAATGVQIVPKGAVAAGAEVEDGKGGNTALVAGGAGLASVGVAGLGFAALRRRGARR